MIFKEVLRIVKIAFIIFFICISIAFTFSLSICSWNFITQLKIQKKSINEDLQKISTNYTNQLIFVKNEIKKLNLNVKEIKEFFHSIRSYPIDRNGIGTIIIADKNFNIIYADNFQESQYNQEHISERDYKDKILLNPNQVIVGNTVTGVLTKKPAIPLVTGILDSNNNLIGFLIFSINLNNLAKNFKLITVDNIFIVDSTIEKQFLYYDNIINSPKQTFSTILFSNEKNYSIAFKNNFGSNIILLSYDVKKLKYEFFIIYFLPYLFSLILLFILIGIANNYKAYKIFSQKCERISFYDKIKAFLEMKSFIHFDNEKFNYLKNEILDLSSFFEQAANLINNKLDIINEDIEEILSDPLILKELQISQHDTLIKKVYDISIKNNLQVKELLSVVFYIANMNKKLNLYNSIQDIDLINLLIQLGINRRIIEIENLYQSTANYLGYDVFVGKFLKDKITNLLQSVINYANSCGTILSINLAKTKYTLKTRNYYRDFKISTKFEFSINFVINLNNDYFFNKEPELTRCRAWAMANSSIINIHSSKKIIILSLVIPVNDF